MKNEYNTPYTHVPKTHLARQAKKDKMNFSVSDIKAKTQKTAVLVSAFYMAQMQLELPHMKFNILKPYCKCAITFTHANGTETILFETLRQGTVAESLKTLDKILISKAGQYLMTIKYLEKSIINGK